MGAVAQLGIVIAILSIPATVSVLVFRDAEKRGIENSYLWAIAVWLSFSLSGAVYSVTGAIAVWLASGLGIFPYLVRRSIPEHQNTEMAENPIADPDLSDESAHADE